MQNTPLERSQMVPILCSQMLPLSWMCYYLLSIKSNQQQKEEIFYSIICMTEESSKFPHKILIMSY